MKAPQEDAQPIAREHKWVIVLELLLGRDFNEDRNLRSLRRINQKASSCLVEAFLQDKAGSKLQQ